jgi:hypothetical protein
MSGTVIRFPGRRSRVIWVFTEAEGEWLVLAGEHGWLHGDIADAHANACWLAANCGLPIRMRVPA